MKINDLLNKPTLSVGELSKKYKVATSAVETELSKGVKVEMEHSNNVNVARKIALAHLGEDLYYYDKLSKVEKGLCENIDQFEPVPDPTPSQLKTLARRNKYHSARFVIYKPDREGQTHWVAADSEHHTHHSAAPAQGAWLVRGYVQYLGDGEYAYRSMEVYSPKTVDHPLFRTWERAGIQNGNPEVVEEKWSKKYKKSINCSNPKGFSQRAHCAGRRKRQAHGKTKSKSISEALIDNVRGWGNVPDNQNVDYLGMRVQMSPRMFLKLATPLSREDATSADDIRNHLSQGGAIASPWLIVKIPPEWADGDFDKPARIVGHEGRNRMIAIQELEGNKPVEVHLFFSGGLRARHIRPEWVQHMNQQLVPQQESSAIPGPFFDHSVQEDTTRTTQKGAPGTLKAKITRLYGGDVTCSKTERLKRRENATAHDKAQANWFQNKHCGGASRVDEIFQEPATQLKWQSYGSSDKQFWLTEFSFYDWPVTIEMHPDVRQIGAKYVFRNQDLTLPPEYTGWHVIFRVNNSTDLTGKLGTNSISVLTQVVSAIKGFLQTHEWDYVFFTGEHGSRDRLYRALSERLAGQIGAQVIQYRSDFVIYKSHTQQESAGVGLVVPGVNMPAGQHPDEIRRQARKFGFKTTKNGVPPTLRTDGKY